MTTAFLHGVEVVEIETGVRPIRSQKSSIIGLVGTAGKGPSNVGVLIVGSRGEAARIFGEFKNDGFSIPEALDAIFDQGGATVVVVNVLDRTVHKTDVTAEAITFSSANIADAAKGHIFDVALDTSLKASIVLDAGGTYLLPVGATIATIKDSTEATTYVENTDFSVTGDASTTGLTITNLDAGIGDGDTVILSYAATLALDTDYSLDLDDGRFTRIAGGKILPEATLSIDYSYSDPTLVDEADVIGSVDSGGLYSGSLCLLQAKSELGVTPRILIAPRWTHQKADAYTANGVVAELAAMAVKLKAHVLADCPDSTKEAAVAYRGDWGTERVLCLYPFLKVANPDGGTALAQPPSARVAGLISYVDNTFGYWNSPSNRIIQGVVGLSRPIDFSLNDRDTVANYLNENEVATFIREDGFRLWGNRTASSDAKYAFLSVSRTRDMIQESILYAHMWAVDRNITKGLVESIVEGVRDYLRTLQARGAILGGTAWADPELNTPTVIQNGELFIDFDFTPPYPAEHITFRAHLVNDYISEIF